MATKKKGVLTASYEWAKHLRKFGKANFWRRERRVSKNEIRKKRYHLAIGQSNKRLTRLTLNSASR